MMLGWKKRQDRRPQRFFASVVALFALSSIASKPTRTSSPSPGSALLITAGAEQEHIQRVIDGHGPFRETFSMIQKSEGRASGIEDLGSLANRGIGDTLHVVGNGLRAFQWEAYEAPVVFHSAPGPDTGVTRLSWTRQISLGETTEIIGAIRWRRDQQWIALFEFGSLVDSTRLDSADGSFVLRYTPREVGRNDLGIGFGEADAPVILETIGISVIEPNPLSVLVLEGSPTFETRHLKTWLATRGARLAVRSAVSRDRFRTEFMNLAQMNLTDVSREILSQFNVLIIDARSWRELTRQNIVAIEERARAGDLGILLLPDEEFIAAGRATTDLFSGFEFDSFSELNERTVRATWTNSTPLANQPLLTLPYTIRRQPHVRSIVWDEFGAIVVGINKDIAINLSGSTYQWILDGRWSEYASLWSQILTGVAPASGNPRWDVGTSGPVLVGEPTPLRLSNAAGVPDPEVISPAGIPTHLPVTQDPLDPTRWSGVFWPREEGWHRINPGRDDEFWFRVNHESEFEAYRAAASVAATQLRSYSRGADFQGEEKKTREPIPTFWFFLLFCTAAGYLWLEPRLG